MTRTQAPLPGPCDPATDEIIQARRASARFAVEPSAPKRNVGTGWAVLLIVLVVSFSYMARELKRGWVPHDEGILAQSAERVLQGELPHRDFVELYTGGLDYLHALSFLLFGTNLGSLRITVFIFFLAAVVAVFYIGSRLASPLTAGAVTLLAVAWSLPNYAAAVPSWYNLFFAIFATAALFRYIETRAERWIVVAGVCSGLSLLVKLHGIFLLPAVILFFVYQTQFMSGDLNDSEKASRGPAVLISVAGLAMVIALAKLLMHKAVHTYYFLLPAAAVITVLLWREWQPERRFRAQSFPALLRRSLLFVAGAAMPTAVFLARYWMAGSLPALYMAVFVAPAARVSTTAIDPPGLPWLLTGLVLPVVLISVAYLRGRVAWLLGILTAIVLGQLLQSAMDSRNLYRIIWSSAATVVPITILIAAFVLLGIIRPAALSGARQQKVFLLMAVTAMCSLVQFPFSAPVYFCYVAPLVALSWLAIFSCWEAPPRVLLGAVIAFYAAFAVLEVTPGFIYQMGWQYAPDLQTATLSMPRAGGLRVRREFAEEYEQVVAAVRQHASGGFMYAAPYCPEIYFLAGLRNPRPQLSEGWNGDATGTILHSLEDHNVHVVVIELSDPVPDVPGKSIDISPALHAALAEKFPNAKAIGRFEIRWRN